jgi:hypothetical protein
MSLWNKRFSLLTILPALALCVSACGDDIGLGADNQLVVTNHTDSFQFQIANMTGVTETLSYTWENTGDQATVNIVQWLSDGSTILTIRDADGTVVLEDDIAEDDDTDSAVGVAGDWSIGLTMQSAEGAFSVSVQKKE